MKSVLTKVIAVLVVGFVVFCGYMAMKNSPKEKQKVQDYQAVDVLIASVKKVLNETDASIHDIPNQWVGFDLADIYSIPKDRLYNKFHYALRDELGEDFPTRLSNGTKFVVSVHANNKEFKIYAGGWCAPDTMIYPKWEYKELPKR